MTGSTTLVSTTIKTWLDETNDTLWSICPFCKAYVKDVSYVGHGLSKRMLGHPLINMHMASEHGKQRTTIGKRQRWLSVSAESQAYAKGEVESDLKIWGKDCIRHNVNR